MIYSFIVFIACCCPLCNSASNFEPFTSQKLFLLFTLKNGQRMTSLGLKEVPAPVAALEQTLTLNCDAP